MGFCGLSHWLHSHQGWVLPACGIMWTRSVAASAISGGFVLWLLALGKGHQTREKKPHWLHTPMPSRGCFQPLPQVPVQVRRSKTHTGLISCSGVNCLFRLPVHGLSTGEFQVSQFVSSCLCHVGLVAWVQSGAPSCFCRCPFSLACAPCLFWCHSDPLHAGSRKSTPRHSCGPAR